MYVPTKHVGWCIGTRQRRSTLVFGRHNLAIFPHTVLENRCAHRGAQLSQGRVNSRGCVVCPYHGWEYDENGVAGSANVRKYEVKEQYGMLWTSFDGVSCPVPPRVPELDTCKWTTGDLEFRGHWKVWVDHFRDLENSEFYEPNTVIQKTDDCIQYFSMTPLSEKKTLITWCISVTEQGIYSARQTVNDMLNAELIIKDICVLQ